MVVFVNDDKMYLKNYDSISEELKYVSNSLIRLKILATLYRCPLNMKELNDLTNVSYSSISSNMHGLELRGYVYRESNKYYLTNDMRLHINDVLELKNIIGLLNEFFNILDGHVIDLIPNESIAELYLLGKANLIESDGVDAYKIYNYIEDILRNAESIKCVLPFYYKNFNDLINEKENVDILVPKSVLDIFEESLMVEDVLYFNENNCFLLIITDEVMLLGLFKENGYFDQNRLLTSKNEECLEWANNLFENFKNKVINEG